MFSFFKKKPKAPGFKDVVWINIASKFKALQRNMQNPSKPLVLITFFEETKMRLDDMIGAGMRNSMVEIYLADRLSFLSNIEGKQIIFAEHHPLIAKGQDALQILIGKGLTEDVPCYSALDESLFTLFGGERIADVMTKLGLSEDESVEHSMVTTAIENARKKISAKVLMTSPYAYSQAEWFAKYYN